MKKIFLYFVLITACRMEMFAQWIEQMQSVSSNIWRVEFDNYFSGYASYDGGILRTADGGNTWQICSGLAAASYRGMTTINENTVLIAAPGGLINKSTNAGIDWQSYQMSMGYWLWGIDAVNSSVIYTVGLHPTNYSGKILKSIDGGMTWAETSYSGTGLFDVQFVNENLGYAVGGGGAIVKIMENGTSFIGQTSNTGNSLWGVNFINQSLGWAVGENGTILKTINGGNNWIVQISNTTQALRRVKFVDEYNGYVVGANGTLLKTNDGGNNWFQDTVLTNNELWGIATYSNTEVWAAGGNGSMYHKTALTNIPEAPELLSPMDLTSNIDLSPQFSWSIVENANSYVFQLSSNEEFTNLVYIDTLINTSLLCPITLNGGTVYYWRVKSIVANLPSIYSGTNRFITQSTATNQNLSMQFNGINQFVETSINTNPTQMPTTTWEAWVYPTRINYNQRQQIISSDNGWYDRSVLIESNSNKFAIFPGLFIYDWGASCWSVCDVDYEQWQHIAVVFDQNAVHFYKNGVKYSREYVNFDTISNYINIGRNPTGNEYYQGKIDEVRIWSRALNQREIIDNYNCGFNDINERIGLEAYYRFNENSNQYCNDETSQYTGIIRNSPNREDGVTCGNLIPVVLTLPVNNAINQSKTPLMSWSQNNNANSYRLIIARDSSFNIIEYDTTITLNQHRVARNSLCCGSEYYWLVLSNTDLGASVSEIRKLTVRECSDTIPNLVTAEWQVYSAPYNAYYPLDSLGNQGSNPCIPTAISRIMHFWKHPLTGRDSSVWQHPTWTAYKDTIRYYQTTYNYSNMPNYLASNATQVQYHDIATLVWHSNTLLEGGGGFTDVINGMHKYMKYSNKMKNLMKKYYTGNQWRNILKNELEDGRPVLYSGFSATSGDGHAWIVDGYNSQGKFHLQYGYYENDNFYDSDSMYYRPAVNTCVIGMEPENYYYGPILITPEYNDNVQNSIYTSWIPRENETSYRIQVSSTKSFNSLVLNQITNIPNYTLNSLTNGNTYYWRVKAYKNNDSSAWSEVRKFYVSTQAGYSLSGTVKYANTTQTTMNNCTVIIKNSANTEVTRTTTNASGAYSLSGIANGTYTIEVLTTKTSGGINTSDLLSMRQRIGGTATYTTLQNKAGDINNNGSIATTDLLPLRLKISNAASNPAWLVPNYVYDPLTVTINGANVELNIQALCGGDVNGSFVPGN